MAGKIIIPPDGGWGWAIVIAYGLNNIIMVGMLQGFSLVLKDAFREHGIDATDRSVIISVNSAFGMTVGLIHGPLLRNFGYRKIALIGSMTFTLGIILTAFATTSAQFMVTYGVIASLGVGLTMSSFSLAINTYFTKNRGRAVGIAMTVTGLGPIVMPQLTSYLLYSYTTQGTILILGAMTLHSLAATALLQPVKWHATWQLKEPANEQKKELGANVIKSITETQGNVLMESEQRANRKSSANTNKIEDKINGIVRRRSTSISNPSEADCPDSESQALPYKWWSSGKSLETINLGSSKMIFDENMTFGPLVIQDDDESETKSLRDTDAKTGREISLGLEDKLLNKEVQETPPSAEKVIEKKLGDSCLRRMLRRIVEFFDFELLRDPIYVNMMLGMAIALFAEINFAVHTPFILEDMGFGNEEIATVMSMTAGVDLVSRGLIPFISEWLGLPARHMALISLLILIVSRSMLIITRSFAAVMVISIGLGFGKGVRSVNMFLVIPNYIPIDRLASATGIQMVANGVILMGFGPFLGWSRDKFGTYGPCLIFINSTTALTIVMWLTEMCIVSRKRKRRERKQHYEQVDVRE